MNAGIKAQWVAALRSGEYPQGRSVLHDVKTNAYCCLGVLCDLADKSGVISRRDWRRVAGGDVELFDNNCTYIPGSVVAWAGLPDVDPPMPRGTTLAALNDAGETFDRIADLIEAEL